MFNHLPDISYDGVLIKNFFRKVKLRDDTFRYTTNFKKYTIKDGETPQDIAHRFYDNINYYWIILLINDIQNVNEDWAMSSLVFEDYISKKYPTDNGLGIKHYITTEIKSNNQIILEGGKIVDPDYSFEYNGFTYNNITIPVTYREYETKINEEKKNIFILKKSYIPQYENEFKSLIKYETKFGIVNNVRLSGV